MAVLQSHTNPVNCVRWNCVGTLFASAGDDEIIVIWEYKGEKVASKLEMASRAGGESQDKFSMAFQKNKEKKKTRIL